MASNTSERDAVIVERLTQLYGAIKVMKKMVGTTSDSWAAESAQAIAGSDPDAPKTLYYNAAKNLYDVTTKFTLIFKDAKTPDQVGTFAETMERALVGIVQSSQSLLKVINAHELLANQVNTLVRDCLEVASKLTSAMSTTFDLTSAPRMTGQIWANCEALEKIDFDATLKSFVLKAVHAQSVSIKDALEELKEEEENQGDLGDEDYYDVQDGDDVEDILNFTLKGDDRKILPGCILFLKTASSFCLQIAKVTDLIDDAADKDNTKAALLKIYEKTQLITEAVDNFNVSIYPPQKPSEVLSSAVALRELLTSVIVILTSVPQLSSHHAKLLQLQSTASALFQQAETQIQNP
jgi:hypothetical protein